MAVNAVTLALDVLAPVLELDEGISAAVTRAVEAQTALQGLDGVVLSEKQKVYLGLLSVKQIIPRLLLLFSQKIKSAKGGSASIEYHKAIEFLEALQQEIKDQIKQAAHEVDPTDNWEDVPLYRWPGVGVTTF